MWIKIKQEDIHVYKRNPKIGGGGCIINVNIEWFTSDYYTLENLKSRTSGLGNHQSWTNGCNTFLKETKQWQLECFCIIKENGVAAMVQPSKP
jgi:hypothetical protein